MSNNYNVKFILEDNTLVYKTCETKKYKNIPLKIFNNYIVGLEIYDSISVLKSFELTKKSKITYIALPLSLTKIKTCSMKHLENLTLLVIPGNEFNCIEEYGIDTRNKKHEPKLTIQFNTTNIKAFDNFNAKFVTSFYCVKKFVVANAEMKKAFLNKFHIQDYKVDVLQQNTLKSKLEEYILRLENNKKYIESCIKEQESYDPMFEKIAKLESEIKDLKSTFENNKLKIEKLNTNN